MKLREIWSGTRAELAAQTRLNAIQGRRSSTTRRTDVTSDQTTVEGLHNRRTVIKALGTVGGFGLVLGTGAVLREYLQKPDIGDVVFNNYLDALVQISQGDDDAEHLAAFLQSRRKKGSVDEEGRMTTKEGGTVGEYFYTAVLPATIDEQDSFLRVDNQHGVPFLIMKNVLVDPLWAGAETARQAQHLRNILTHSDQFTEEYLQGLYKAFDIHFRLLNKETSGNFTLALRERALLVEQFSTEVVALRHDLPQEDFDALSSPFQPYQSEEEFNLRKNSLLVALNFAVIDHNTQRATDRVIHKLAYLQQIVQG